jgi:hypothetical protein
MFSFDIGGTKSGFGVDLGEWEVSDVALFYFTRYQTNAPFSLKVIPSIAQLAKPTSTLQAIAISVTR